MNNKHTTTFQFSILFFLTILALFSTIGYKYFLKLSIYNTILSIIIGTILGIIILAFYFLIFKRINIKKIIKNKFIKIFILIIYSLLFSYFTYKYSTLINYIYLPNNHIIFTSFTILLIFLYLNNIKTFILSRVIEILFYMFLLLFFIHSGSFISQVNPYFLLPAITNNYINLIISSSIFALISSSSIILLYVFYNKEINKKKIKSYLFISYTTSCIFILITYIFIISILGNKLAIFYTYPEIMILKNLSMFSIFERIDYILTFEYLISSFTIISIILINIKKIINSFHTAFIEKYFYIYIIFLFIISIVFN